MLRERTFRYTNLHVRVLAPRNQSQYLAARGRRRRGSDHVDPRHDDRQRRNRDAVRRSREPDQLRAVGRHGLHACARRGDPCHRLGGAPARNAAPLPDLARPLHARVAALRLRLVDELVDRVPRPSGPRRRDADADRNDHPGARGRPPPDGSHPQHRRRPDGARTGIRPGHRRPARRAFRLALDLLHQHPGRDHRGCSRVEAAPGRKGRGRRQARRAGARPPRDRIARPHLRPRQGRQRRRLRVGAGARSDRDRAGVDRRFRVPLAAVAEPACSMFGSTPTAPSRLPRPRRSSSGHPSSAP